MLVLFVKLIDVKHLEDVGHLESINKLEKNMKIIIIILFLIPNIIFNQTKYSLPCDKLLLQVSMDSAISQVGEMEFIGKRYNPKILLYLSSVGLGTGQPFCTAGVYWCFSSAAAGLGLSQNFIPIIRSGMANAIFNDARMCGAKSKYSVNVHDLIVWRKNNSFHGHIERVIEVFRAGWVKTVGFNTSSEKSQALNSEKGVFFRKRNVFHALGRMKIRGLVGFN